MYIGNCIGCIGYKAPVGVTRMYESWKYVRPSIGNAQLWKERVIQPKNLIDSTLGLVTGPLSINPAPGLVAESTLPTEEGAVVDQLFKDFHESMAETGIYEEMPDWMRQLYDYLPTGEKQTSEMSAPEENEMSDTIPTPMPEPGFLEKNGKLILFGGIAVATFVLLSKKKLFA